MVERVALVFRRVLAVVHRPVFKKQTQQSKYAAQLPTKKKKKYLVIITFTGIVVEFRWL
jgi:hypothetical protein